MVKLKVTNEVFQVEVSWRFVRMSDGMGDACSVIVL